MFDVKINWRSCRISVCVYSLHWRHMIGWLNNGMNKWVYRCIIDLHYNAFFWWCVHNDQTCKTENEHALMYCIATIIFHFMFLCELSITGHTVKFTRWGPCWLECYGQKLGHSWWDLCPVTDLARELQIKNVYLKDCFKICIWCVLRQDTKLNCPWRLFRWGSMRWSHDQPVIRKW